MSLLPTLLMMTLLLCLACIKSRLVTPFVPRSFGRWPFACHWLTPEPARLSSRGATCPPDSEWKARYTGPSPSADTTKLVPNKDANYDARTQTSRAVLGNTITPMPIGGLNLKDKHYVHVCLLDSLRYNFHLRTSFQVILP